MSTRPVRTQTLRPFAALAAATTLLAPAFAHAAGPSLEQRTLDALAERVIAEPDTAVALAIGHMLGRMQLYVSTPHAAEVVGKVAREAKSPIVRAAFARAHTRALQDMGQWDDTPEGYAKKFGAQGCLTDFSLVGPFDNSSMEGLDTPYGPELGEVGPYTGKLVEVDWRALPDAHRMCELNLGSFVAPRAASIVYLSARIDSPSKRDARLLMGADGAYRVWLNGEPVARRDVDDGLSRDDAAWTLPLRKGSNEVVFKIASTQDGTLDLVARLTDAKLAPLTDLKVTPSQPKTRLNEVAAIERTGQGALALAREAAEGSDADAVWAAWLLSRLATRDASTPWRGTADRVLAEVKAGKAKLDPWAFIALAELFEEQFKRVEVLELARAAHANDLWVAIELARLRRRALRGHPPRRARSARGGRREGPYLLHGAPVARRLVQPGRPLLQGSDAAPGGRGSRRALIAQLLDSVGVFGAQQRLEGGRRRAARQDRAGRDAVERDDLEARGRAARQG